MEIHVTKHHQAYVTNLNAALVQYAEVSKPSPQPQNLGQANRRCFHPCSLHTG